MYTAKLKIGAEWRLPKIKESIKHNEWPFTSGKQMTDISAIKELMKNLKKQYKTVTQKDGNNYVIIEAK